jgi:DNA-binding beta-propeller fold protein YncE
VALRHLGFIDLPAHANAGGFDHAAVHDPTGRVYVAHTANDTVDVIDVQRQRSSAPFQGWRASRGRSSPSPISSSPRTAPRTPSAFSPSGTRRASRRSVSGSGRTVSPTIRGAGGSSPRTSGTRPSPGSCTVSIVDVRARKRLADVDVAGRTRWTVYDRLGDAFHVNIADPPQIVVVEAGDPLRVRRVVAIPHAGPHGLDIDVAHRRLFCACDAGVLLEVDADSGKVLATDSIAGVPDVVFFNAALGRLYVAIGDPGVIEIFDTAPLRRREIVTTEAGAHTLSFDASRNVVCAFLPASHRAAVYEDDA